MKRLLLILVVVCGSAWAQITTTATQVVLSYSASTTSQCTVEVSTNSSYSPMVHAVDPTIFTNANLDGQTNAGARQFVVGQRWIATETVSTPSITIGASAASRAPFTLRASPGPSVYGAITVTYTSQPFIAGDNIIVTGMTNTAYNTALGRVMIAFANSFTYWVPVSGTDTSGSGTITRSNSYSLALENATTYYYRIGGASNTCGSKLTTGTFTTMNWPNGDTWAENAPLGNNGIPVLPTIRESQAAIGSSPDPTVIDPITGTLMKPLSLWSDDHGYEQKGAGGAKCSWQADTNGFYHCYVQFGVSGSSKLYAINETTGEVRFLGALNFTSNIGECGTNSVPSVNPNAGGVWDATNPNVLYGICLTKVSTYGAHSDVFQATYNGNDVAFTSGAGTGVNASFAPLVMLTPSATGYSLDELLVTDNSSYNTTEFTGCGAYYVIDGYLGIECSRWNQGSPTWVAMFNLGDELPIDDTCTSEGGSVRNNCPRVAAFMSQWGNQLAATSCAGTAPYYCTGVYPFRWNGSHSIGQFDGPAYGWAAESLSYMNGGGTMGPFNVTLNQGAGLNATDLTDTITVTSTPPAVCNTYGAGAAGDPMSATCPPDGSPFLDQALPGDNLIWTVGGEVDQVLARNNATSLTIARGCHLDNSFNEECDGTGRTTHANGATFYMAPLEFVGNCCSFAWWNFTSDIHGHDQTGTSLVAATTFVPSHWTGNNPYIMDEGWNLKNNSTWNAAFFHAGLDYSVSPTPPFNGINNQCGGSSCNMYPHYDPINTGTQTWFWESATYTGQAYTDPVATVISSGTGYIIALYNFQVTPPNPFSPTLPYFSVSKQYSLVDISAPGSALPASSSGNYEFCIVHVSGECWAGSTVGEVYANLPFTPVACAATETEIITVNDWCVNNMFSMIVGIEQVGANPANLIGTAGGKPLYGANSSRKLVQGTYPPPRWVGSTGALTIPDDSWVWKDTCIEDTYLNAYTGGGESPVNCIDEVYMWKVPAQPPVDTTNRTTYTNVTITIGNPGGASHANVAYGFEENEPIRGTTWPPTIHFYGTQYQGESTTACTTLGQSPTYAIGVPQRVLFYQVQYFNNSSCTGTPVSTGALTAVTTDPVVTPSGPAFSAPPNPINFPNQQENTSSNPITETISNPGTSLFCGTAADSTTGSAPDCPS
jgi:hypothetical protein